MPASPGMMVEVVLTLAAMTVIRIPLWVPLAIILAVLVGLLILFMVLRHR